MMVQYWINGKPQCCLNTDDRAIQYGDGLFETIRVRDRRPEFLNRHFSRLMEGSRRLKLSSIPWKSLESEIRELASQHYDAILKIIVSRGAGKRGYRFDATSEATRLIGLYPVTDVPTDRQSVGVRARVCATRLARQPALAGIKHLNRLEQVLARSEWDDSSIHEGLMLDTADQLIEGTMSNLFLVQDNALLTPDLSECGVAGIMRSVIIDLAREQGIEVTIQAVTLQDVLVAQELFFCNSLIGIWPINTIDTVRDLAIGPVTRQLVAALATQSDFGSSNWYAS
jgi:4-amino-4-deoxychorismate lyase